MIDLDREVFLNESQVEILVNDYDFSLTDAEQIIIAFNKLKWATETEMTIDELMQIFNNYEKEN